jgi:hypothetical protein
MMEKISYNHLNAKQKETFNFQKVSAILADYGFATIKLNDDWQGADFIAQHIDGDTYLKVQLKGRLTFDKKYFGKDLHICFPYRNTWYLFPHDEMLNAFLKEFSDKMAISSSWTNHGSYSWNSLSKRILEILNNYQL